MSQQDPTSDFPKSSVQTVATKSSKKRIDPAALLLLLKLPNATQTVLEECLYLAQLVSPTEAIYRFILTYVANGLVHGYSMKVVNIFRIVRDQEFDHDEKMKKQLRLLLWHGTKEGSVAGILQTGFKIPSAKNQMFGTGIYFADRSSKSANYCLPTLNPTRIKGDTAYMFLCDVAVGKWYNSKNPKPEVTEAPVVQTKSGTTKPCASVKCTGEYIPDESENVNFNGCLIPLGKTIKNDKFEEYSVKFNEFIVYDSNRVRTKYLVKVEFT
ncbi:unnamed protein product [Orchesella dallaii]|uniref:Poly [ADP-ribose] polymerase n=1 Tax=Orchesella dallaii TaxID=48710 RepID=A0ABP1RUS7_9HEXA